MDVVEVVLGVLDTLFWIALLVTPSSSAGGGVLQPRFTERMFRSQERFWHIKFPSWYLLYGRVFTFILGLIFLTVGVMHAIQELSRIGLVPE